MELLLLLIKRVVSRDLPAVAVKYKWPTEMARRRNEVREGDLII